MFNVTMCTRKYQLEDLVTSEIERRVTQTPQERADEDDVIAAFQNATPVGREFGAPKANTRL